MKRMDFLCTSRASTAVCSSLDHRSVLHGTRPIYRSNSSKYYAPCSASQLPLTPKSFSYERTRKSSAKPSDLGPKSSAESRDIYYNITKTSYDLRRKSSADASDIKSPSSSARYLLCEKPYVDWISESEDHVSALVPSSELVHVKPRHTKVSSKSNDHFNGSKSGSLVVSNGWVSEAAHETPRLRDLTRHTSNHHSPAMKSSSSARSRDQVVVLKVSIHCKGCEGKVRKHISKMEGVTSFSIDSATKKVTIIGNVTPLGVLASFSRVKNAQLWPSPTSSSSSSSPSQLPLPSPSWST